MYIYNIFLGSIYNIIATKSLSVPKKNEEENSNTYSAGRFS